MCMLLAVVELIGSNKISANRIYFDALLKQTFSRYLDQYRSERDRDNPHHPFFHLRSEAFWHHQVRVGAEQQYSQLTTAPSSKVVDDNIAYVYLDEELFELLQNEYARQYLKAALESSLDEQQLRGILEQARGWDWLECEATVISYFSMLQQELSGKRYNKAEHRRNLQPLLSGRSESSIEFKHQNISAILAELGFPYINGYKPAYNYQHQLKEVVQMFLAGNYQGIVTESEQYVETVPDEKPLIDWGSVLESPPEIEHTPARVAEPKRSYTPRKYNFVEGEKRNRRLGEAGEQFVMEYERHRMAQNGRSDLVEEVEWTSKEQGDGAGYDIRSFDPIKDEELFIEVKTTNSGKYQPFMISENEVAFSRDRADHYALYRVFSYKKGPRLFNLFGRVEEHVRLVPKMYRAEF